MRHFRPPGVSTVLRTPRRTIFRTVPAPRFSMFAASPTVTDNPFIWQSLRPRVARLQLRYAQQESSAFLDHLVDGCMTS